MNDARFWQDTAHRVARQLNIGRWLETTLPVWAAASVVAACTLLLLRNRGELAWPWFWTGVALAGVVVGVAVFVIDTRHHLTSSDDALVWLERRLRLNNQLSTACAGIGRWPGPRDDARALLAWRPSRLLPAPLFCTALLAAASWIPVTRVEAPMPPPLAPPAAWTEMDRWLEEVEQTELVDENAVDVWEDRLASLESQPQQEWYEHSSLEAGDSLRDELASELRALERSLSDAETSLSEMMALDENASPEKRRLAQKRLGETLDDLELASLPLSAKIKRQLMTLARERKVKRMSQEQLEQLRERLRQRRYANLPRPGDDAYAFLTPGEAGSEASNGKPGKGGVNRGPGSAPIELADERTELGTNRIEDVMGREPLGTEFGETVAVGIGEHDVDSSGFRTGRDAGGVVSVGEGGELVWSQTLTPEERRVLEKYFK